MAKKLMNVRLSGTFEVTVNGSASRTSAIADAFKKLEMAFPDGVDILNLDVEEVFDV